MDITSLEQQAVDFARRGEFGADAKRVNEELTKLAPGNEGAWTRLARCNIELGLLDAANEALEQALHINPQNTIARSLLQESIRRQVRLSAPEPKPKRSAGARAPRARGGGAGPVRGGFGRAQFAALGQLAPADALESLSPSIEPLLVALAERPFAAKVVDARNRAGRSGNRLFRRNSIYAGGSGHVYAFHHGGRWEPQINLGFFAAPQWERSMIRAGIGFNLSQSGSDPDRESGQERVIAYWEQFQQLVSTAWTRLLTDWMASHGGFIQYADRPPAVEMLPKDAVQWIVSNQHAVEQGWVFVGGWLFGDRPEHAATMEDPAALLKWADETFNGLLPLWTSVYRGSQ